MSSPFTLAVCAEMVFTELPFEERVRRLDALGFEVEIWGWRAKDISTLAATEASFSSMTGYMSGDLVDPGRADELLRTAELSIPIARRLGIPRLNLRTDRCVPGLGEPVPHGDGGGGRRCCGGFPRRSRRGLRGPALASPRRARQHRSAGAVHPAVTRSEKCGGGRGRPR